VDAVLNIRRVQASDGVEVAYSIAGEGSPLLTLFPYHGSDLLLNWAVPVHRRGLEHLARHFQVIAIDLRGSGQSQREVSRLEFESFAQDVLAVLDELKLTRVGCLALGNSSLIAAFFASTLPERLTRLVLYSAGDSTVNRHLHELHSQNLEVEAGLRAAVLGGLRDPQNTESLAAVFRNAVSPEMLRKFEDLISYTDVQAILKTVTAPTLFISASEDSLISTESARAMASLVVNARVSTFRGTSPLSIWRNPEAMDEIVSFLLGGSSPSARKRIRRARHTPAMSLTAREAEVLSLLASGMTNQQIAHELFISVNTVRHHLKNVFLKTNVSNRTEAASIARQNELSG
jgi:DNA-binding NarL/FixJ family response regulator